MRSTRKKRPARAPQKRAPSKLARLGRGVLYTFFALLPLTVAWLIARSTPALAPTIVPAVPSASCAEQPLYLIFSKPCARKTIP